MLGQPLVDERVVRCQQVEHVLVAAHDAVEEQLGLGLEGITQRVVEVGELVVVGCNRPQVPGVQPLTAEVADEGIGLRVGNHPAHFTLEHRRIAKLTLHRQIHQRIVRDAAPEEERQSRRKLDVGHVLQRAGFAVGLSSSTRNTNDGLASSRRSAIWMPLSKFPLARPAR